MFIYNVTVNIDESVHEEWLAWMKEVHIPDVMRTGCFIDSQLVKVLGQDEGHTYSFQYKFLEMEDYENYQKNFAAKLQREVRDRYEGKFAAFRTLLEIM
ncbi:MAG: DUF4286 family protein [Bacteroidia bacterium]